MKESPTDMIIHSAIIGLIASIGLRVSKVSPDVSDTWANMIFAFALMYMSLFGHGLPTKLSPLLIST